MNLLFTINEAAPLYKIGGLGDVGNALPIALKQLGIDVRLALPMHPEIKLDSTHAHTIDSFSLIYDTRELSVKVIQTTLPSTNIPVYLFNENKYLSDHTDASDNHADKYAVFSLVIVHWLSRANSSWSPTLIHAHDWHTALIPFIIKHRYHSDLKTVITIHNLAYQGDTNTMVANKLNISKDKCHILSWDLQDSAINILMEGLLHSDHITTVSPTYAKEITTPEFGERMHHILQTKQSHLSGILNGINTHEFNPETDSHLIQKYQPQQSDQGKQINKHHIHRQFQFTSDLSIPLIIYIGRVDGHQKGIDLIIQALETGQFKNRNLNFIFLGTGDPQLEQKLHQSSSSQPNIRIITRFDEPLARNLYAAADFCLIPSKFEPCGLVQLIAMRYGTIPIARNTGGLMDTIQDEITGFLFKNYTTASMMAAIDRGLSSVPNTSHKQMVKNVLNQDFSWTKSAQKYATLYHDIALGNGLTVPIDNS